MTVKKRRRGERGKGRKAGDDRVTSNQILGAAIDLFAVRGFMSTSLQAIADKLGVSQSAVMYYFPNKTKLFEGCISLIQTRNKAVVETQVAAEDDALIRLRKHFHSNLKWATDSPEEAQIILLLYSLAAFDPGFAALNIQVLQVAREKIRAFLLAGQREQLFHLKIDIAVCAETLHDSLLAGILTWLTTRKHLKDNKAHLKRLKAKWDELIASVTGVGAVLKKVPRG
ncbi:MAG: TetR family transcriptional regulator [Deltaproteobacteria bacterium]|nr:TetR family transcriptional regulator [Deltaproteobacteria bacterium]